MGYAVYHSEKGKSGAAAIGGHIDRAEGYERSYRNADSALRSLNSDMLNNKFTKMPLTEAIKTRLDEGYTGKKAIRKDAVKYLKHVFTGSYEEMSEMAKSNGENGKLKEWAQRNYDFACKEFGAENIVRFTLHLDEKTPHIHCVTVPLTEDGRLSAKEVLGNPKAMSERQDRYAEAMQTFGLERGLKATGIKHETAKQYYGRISQIDKEVLLKTEGLEQIIDRAKITLLNIKSAKSHLKAEISTFNKNNGIIQGKGILAQNEALRRQNKAAKHTEAYAKVVGAAHDIKQSISLLDYFSKLAEIGKLKFEGRKGNEYYFGSEGQATGSIAVNPIKNVWYDHATQEGGDILTAERVFNNRRFIEAVKHLSGYQEGFINCSLRIMKSVDTSIQEEGQQNTDKATITAVFNRISHPALRNYVRSRGLDPDKDVPGAREVHWNKGDKSYFAVGFKTPKDGFVLRNAGFKGNIGAVAPIIMKSQAMIKQNAEAKSFKLFEGMFDFYAYQKLFPMQKFAAVILNGVANLTAKLIENLRRTPKPKEAYLDNDAAGKSATAKLQQEIPDSKDGSKIYEKYKDVNELLMKEGTKQNQTKKRGFYM